MSSPVGFEGIYHIWTCFCGGLEQMDFVLVDVFWERGGVSSVGGLGWWCTVLVWDASSCGQVLKLPGKFSQATCETGPRSAIVEGFCCVGVLRIHLKLTSCAGATPDAVDVRFCLATAICKCSCKKDPWVQNG